MAATTVVERVERLNRASLRRVVEPDVDLPGEVGPGQVIADELLSVAGLDLDLTPEQRAGLSREEVASMLDAGIRFEAILEAGFALQIAQADDITDARITYLCHEMGEETRHQRMFQRVVRELVPAEKRVKTRSLVALALPEPQGVVGVVCSPEAPLLGFVSLVMPAIAMGNRVIATPSPLQPLAACDLYQVLDTSDVPGGVVNIVTGDRNTLADTMAKHDDIAALWYFGDAAGTAMAERESAGNLKAVWANNGKARDWYDPEQGEGEEFLFRATRIKTIWTPFGI